MAAVIQKFDNWQGKRARLIIKLQNCNCSVRKLHKSAAQIRELLVQNAGHKSRTCTAVTENCNSLFFGVGPRGSLTHIPIVQPLTNISQPFKLLISFFTNIISITGILPGGLNLHPVVAKLRGDYIYRPA